MTARGRGLSAETRAVIEAVLEALDLPYAATTGGEEVREAIIGHRLLRTMVHLRGIAERDDAEDILAADLEHLRESLTEFPAAGYVTHDQAQRRLAAGASWADAVRLDYRPPAGADQDEEECGEPDRAPLIVAAPTEPPITCTLQDDPDGGCVAEFIDGAWTFADCDCIECRTRLAEDPTSGEEL